MPTLPEWFQRLPAIIDVFESVSARAFDRADFEKIFGIGRSQAIRLMHEFGTLKAGKSGTFTVRRSDVLKHLRAMRAAFEEEAERRAEMFAKLERDRRSAPAAAFRVAVTPNVYEMRAADLAPGIHLSPGELRVEFDGMEDLVRRLFELSQAMANDFAVFKARGEARKAEAAG